MEEERKLTKTKKKRKRTVISPHEIDILESSFKGQPRPDRFAKVKLAKQMGKTETFISIWFQNRRARERRTSQCEMHGNATAATSRSTSTLYNYRVPSVIAQRTWTPGSSAAAGSSHKTSNPVSRLPLFGRIIRMAAAAEGGILSTVSPHFEEAITDACKGINLSDGRLTYKCDVGFEVEDL